MKSRKRVGRIDSGATFGLLRSHSATILRKGGKSIASLWMRVGRIFLGFFNSWSSFRQKNAPASCSLSRRLAQIEYANEVLPMPGKP